ncbi:hypothetical protein Trydic_g20013 [Trypoxylus dichotomus]
MATFNPVMQEQLRRIRSSEIHDHYLGANIQNELIKLLSEKVKEEIVSDIKAAKYFSVLLDCTPDLSHQEQLSFVIRFVRTENNASATKHKSVGVTEHFLEFLDVKSTTGKNLTDVLLEELDKIGLEIKDCRSQGYDNGSNTNSVKELKSIKQGQLLEKCKALEASLSFEGQKDICGDDLFTELNVLHDLLPAKVETAAGVLRFMNNIQNPYPNTFIAYRILLAIPVTERLWQHYR